MSSVEIVEYINATRGPGSAPLLHKSFLTKTRKVLGVAANNFAGTSTYVNGGGGTQSREVFNFPKREAMLMAMSYSYELQAVVFDAWQAAEATTAPWRGEHHHSDTGLAVYARIRLVAPLLAFPVCAQHGIAPAGTHSSYTLKLYTQAYNQAVKTFNNHHY
jgi:hypothetical protein